MSAPDEPGLSEPIPWSDVPVGAVVMYGIPRRVNVNDPWQHYRTVMLDGGGNR